MKTLVNKNNPALRITAPEIIEEEEYYTLDGENVFLKDNWTLVEEEPTEGIKGNLEEIPSNVDLEGEYKEYVEDDPVYSKLVNGIVGKSIARHFYELGLKARKEE